LVFWYQDSTRGTGGTGQFFFDVVFVGLIVVAPLAMLAIAITAVLVEFIRGLLVFAFSDLGLWLSKKRNGEAARNGDARAQARIDRWMRWRKEVGIRGRPEHEDYLAAYERRHQPDP